MYAFLSFWSICVLLLGRNLKDVWIFFSFWTICILYVGCNLNVDHLWPYVKQGSMQKKKHLGTSWLLGIFLVSSNLIPEPAWLLDYFLGRQQLYLVARNNISTQMYVSIFNYQGQLALENFLGSQQFSGMWLRFHEKLLKSAWMTFQPIHEPGDIIWAPYMCTFDAFFALSTATNVTS